MPQAKFDLLVDFNQEQYNNALFELTSQTFSQMFLNLLKLFTI